MSPNGTLLAYSTPANIKELRDDATIASIAWKDHQAKGAKTSRRPDSPASVASSTISEGALETLTIEQTKNNLIIRAIQPKLLLVMIGGVPPDRKKDFKMTPEFKGGERYPSGNLSPNHSRQPSHGSSSASLPRNSPSNLSTMSRKEKDMKLGVLHVQRKKLDELTNFIRDDFDVKGFVMPDDPQFQ